MPPRKPKKADSAVESKPMNRGLSAAKTAKKDEFYTQYVDIQKEVEAYLEFDPDTFRGKVVYCNCDDPFESNFFKYFAANFNKLGLKKLVTTSYDGSPIAGAQLTFGEYEEGNDRREKPKAIAVEIEEVKDLSGDGATGIEDVKLFLNQNPHTRTRLAGGGDFRSAECVELLNRQTSSSPTCRFPSSGVRRPARETPKEVPDHRVQIRSPTRRYFRSSKITGCGLVARTSM